MNYKVRTYLELGSVTVAMTICGPKICLWAESGLFRDNKVSCLAAHGPCLFGPTTEYLRHTSTRESVLADMCHGGAEVVVWYYRDSEGMNVFAEIDMVFE